MLSVSFIVESAVYGVKSTFIQKLQLLEGVEIRGLGT